MKNLIFAVGCLFIMMSFGCDREINNVDLSEDSYTALHKHILTAELNMYQNDIGDLESNLNKVIELLKDDKNLFCPFQNAKINEAISVSQNILDKSTIAGLDYQLDQLRLFKRHIYNMDTDSEIDFFVLYLWHYEEQMYHSTKAAIDPKLDLYEWEEFVDEVSCLSESWDILNHHYPAPRTLDYDQLKYKNQVVVKEELKKATLAFTTLVTYGQADQNVVRYSAEYLRKKYIEYLEVLIYDPMEQYASNQSRVN